MQYDITLYQPARTGEGHPWAADVYRVTGPTQIVAGRPVPVEPRDRRRRVHCGRGWPTMAEALDEAKAFITNGGIPDMPPPLATGARGEAGWACDRLAISCGGTVGGTLRTMHRYDFETTVDMDRFCDMVEGATGHRPVSSRIKKQAAVDNVIETTYLENLE